MNNTDKIRESLSEVDRAEVNEREAESELELAKRRRQAAIDHRVRAYKAAERTLHAVYGDKAKKVVYNQRIFSYQTKAIPGTSGLEPEIMVDGEAIVLDIERKEKAET